MGLAALGAALLLPSPAAAQAAAGQSFWTRTVYAADATFDVLFLRTTGLITTGVGVVAFVPAAFLTSPGGSDAIREALDIFVLTPGRYTFTRPLGAS